MPSFGPRSLPLHTLDSICADLVSGRTVDVGTEEQFELPDEATRSALEWYRRRGASKWAAPVTAAAGEELVDAIQSAPPTLPVMRTQAIDSSSRRLTLKRLEAHRFAGLHMFGTPSQAPPNFIQEFSPQLTLFEGQNGSGKTSLINAVVWVLTGRILRSQREPERPGEFECWIENEDDNGARTAHKLNSVTPLPNVGDYRPDKGGIPSDTWVELIFEDENGKELAPVRRTHQRVAQGRPVDTEPNLNILGVDPIALRVGTLMPAILPHIKVGSESEFGRAVAQLTGLSGLTDLADNARRARDKIDREFMPAKKKEVVAADGSYNRARADLMAEMSERSAIASPIMVPPPSSDPTIDQALIELGNHFEAAKATALSAAKSVLGDAFDPNDPALRADLEANVGPALAEVQQIGRMRSLARLADFRNLSDEQLTTTAARISDIQREAETLRGLATSPLEAGRARLYARLASWLADHPEFAQDDDTCSICGGTIVDKLDPVTGRSIQKHIREARSTDVFIGQTLKQWAKSLLGEISQNLPESLQLEIQRDLPPHPIDLIRDGLTSELFATEPFRGVLRSLRQAVEADFDMACSDIPSLEAPPTIDLPPECAELTRSLRRLARAIQFARWRQRNDSFVRQVFEQVIGKKPAPGLAIKSASLRSHLYSLEKIVTDVAPLNKAINACDRLRADLKKRRSCEKRIHEYEVASSALFNITKLGSLADTQVDELRRSLHADATKWRRRIYLGAFPSTAQELVDTAMSRRGELDLVVGSGLVSAPAQHVANSSALRASLVAFFLAFWEYVLKTRGGLRLLILDDPQELFDEGNRERLAEANLALVAIGAQIVIATHDSRFAAYISRLALPARSRHSVFPATPNRPVVRTPLFEAEINQRKKSFENNIDDPALARTYAESCRVFLEAMVADLFDDPSYSAWIRAMPSPTLSNFVDRLKSLTTGSPQGMFSASVFQEFVCHPGLIYNSATARLLNKAHHAQRETITAAEVAECKDQLADLVKLADKMHEECRRWRRRDHGIVLTKAVATLAPLSPSVAPNIKVEVCPDLAAFTGWRPAGPSQESSNPLDASILAGKAFFGLRRDNFGFSAPRGAIAIVEADALPVADRHLVVARYGDRVYARRLIRDGSSDFVGLTAETPDPRRSPKTVVLPSSEVSLHPVVGVIFQSGLSFGLGQDEAVLIDGVGLLEKITIAYRIKDDSAVPLALPKQVVLGSHAIRLDELRNYENALVAIYLDDGSSLFKRVGKALAGELAHLRLFESIGGLGDAQILAVEKHQAGVPRIDQIRLISGVLYLA